MSALDTPARKIQSHLHKLRHSPIAIVAFLIFAAGAGLVFSLWMQRGDMTVQQARMALANGKPHLALNMVEPVLQKTPHLLYARCLQVEAQLSLHQFPQAKESLQLAIQDHPAASVVRELWVRWTIDYAKFSMQQPGFSTSTDLQKTFDEIVESGRVQAEWFLDQHDASSAIQSRYILACMVDLKIQRFKAVQLFPSNSIMPYSEKSAHLVAYSPLDTNRNNFDHYLDTLFCELEGHLKAVLRLAPNHDNAWMIYIDYLMEHHDALTIWESANTLSQRSDLPAKLVARMVTSLLTEINTLLPKDRIVEIGFKLLDGVRLSDRTTVDYQLAAARLHLLIGDQFEVLKLLDQVIKLETVDP